jgi:glycosyltransferase involved in cell wall biosynthesis
VDRIILNTYIGVDCIALPDGFSGAANYIYNLTHSLLSANRPFPIALICRPIHAPAFEKIIKAEDKLIKVPLRNRLHKLLFYEYRLSSLLINKNIKIFHATHYITPKQSEFYKIITTFHDMGFLLHPGYYPFVKRLYFRKRMYTFITRSDVVLAVSEATRDSIVEIFPQSRAKINTIYPGVNHMNIGDSKDRKKKYLLAVNSFEKRKNIPFLIKVFNLLKCKYKLEHQFIVIGDHTNDYPNVLAEVNRSPYKMDIILLNSISKQELVSYYQNADIFVNASTYEGFGFTPFEAIGLSCPSFLYNNNVLKKVFKAHQYLLNTLDVHEWADLIAEQLKLGFPNKIERSQIELFTWENNAKKTIELYSKLLMQRAASFD